MNSLKALFSSKILFSICLMLFFWAMFDGIISYITPITIKHAGYSNTMLGIILGTSSLAGAAFDFLLSKYLTRTHFRRVFLLMFICCSLYPLILYGAHSIWIFVLAMIFWGLYYDLNNFGSLDFVGRKFAGNINSAGFFLINMFMNFGYMVFYPAFVASSILILNWQSIRFLYIFLGISFLFYILLIFLDRKEKKEFLPNRAYKSLSFLGEGTLWLKISKRLMPLLIVTLLLNIYDSFFWTLWPLLTENITSFQKLTEKIISLTTMMENNVPIYIINQKLVELFPININLLLIYDLSLIAALCIIGFFRQKLGKKRIAFLFFLIGSLLLILLFFIHDTLTLFLNIICSTFFFSFAISSLEGAYADYITLSASIEKEIEGLKDFFVNIGYIIGPVISGILADRVGYIESFALLGIICAAAALIIFLMSVNNKATNSLDIQP